MKKLYLLCILIFFAKDNLCISQTNRKQDNSINTEKPKRHSLGLGTISILSLGQFIYFKAVSSISRTNSSTHYPAKYILGTQGFMIFSLHHKFQINNKLNYSSLLRIDYTGPKRSSPFYGINLYPTINYNFYDQKLKIGIGSSIILGQYNIRNSITNEVLEAKKVFIAFPLFFSEFNFLKNKNSRGDLEIKQFSIISQFFFFFIHFQCKLGVVAGSGRVWYVEHERVSNSGNTSFLSFS